MMPSTITRTRGGAVALAALLLLAPDFLRAADIFDMEAIRDPKTLEIKVLQG